MNKNSKTTRYAGSLKFKNVVSKLSLELYVDVLNHPSNCTLFQYLHLE